jgi:hypothetical protein
LTRSDVILIFKIGNQKIEFDIENPVGDIRKNPNNEFFMI